MGLEYKFKEGDRVRMLSDCSGLDEGDETVLAPFNDMLMALKLDDQTSGCLCPRYWELITNEEPMSEDHEFKLGDRVTEDDDLATVIGFSIEGKILITYDNGGYNDSYWRPVCLKLIKSNDKTMSNLVELTARQEDKLKADDKALIRAGFANDKLERTPDGSAALQVILENHFEADLVALAKAKIAKEEKANKAKK